MSAEDYNSITNWSLKPADAVSQSLRDVRHDESFFGSLWSPVKYRLMYRESCWAICRFICDGESAGKYFFINFLLSGEMFNPSKQREQPSRLLRDYLAMKAGQDGSEA